MNIDSKVRGVRRSHGPIRNEIGKEEKCLGVHLDTVTVVTLHHNARVCYQPTAAVATSKNHVVATLCTCARRLRSSVPIPLQIFRGFLHFCIKIQPLSQTTSSILKTSISSDGK
jgi:hypothetical protein